MAEKQPTRRKFLRNTTLAAAGALMGAFSTTGYSSSPQKAEDISRYNPQQNGGCAVSFGYDMDMPGTDGCNGSYYLYDRSLGWMCGVNAHLNQDIRDYINLLGTRAEDAGVKLQFFLEGNTFEKPEDMAHWKAFAKRGHALDSHMYYHDSLINTPVDEVTRQLKKTKGIIETELGQKNIGLRGPGGYRNAMRGHEDAQRAVLEAGIEWVSSQFQYPSNPQDDNAWVKRIPMQQPFYYETGLLEIPFCGHQDRSFFDVDMGGSPRPLDEWIAYLKQCVDIAREKNLFLSLTVHPSTSFKHDAQARYLKEIFAYCQQWPDIILCTYRDMYRWISNDKSAYS
jgi:peptidoglycan/xylan/chitin deacetylase (PgdA/CDA1 family)